MIINIEMRMLVSNKCLMSVIRLGINSLTLYAKTP